MPERRGPRFSSGRHAGLLVPLFSIPSRRSWGIGEIPDLVPLARWVQSSGLDFVQLLPLNEMQEGQSSPYSALSAMAIDPLFIALDQVADWTAAGSDAMDDTDRAALACARDASRVDYAAVRAVKGRALRTAFARFTRHVLGTAGSRERRFHAFRERERWWLDDYSIFRALHDLNGGSHWREWDPGVRDRDPAAIDAVRERLRGEIDYYAYLQWLANEQWQRARKKAAPTGVFGDFPFMVSGHSADVWARQGEFDVDASVGTPPDAFSETGQDWGLPPYRWDVVESTGYAWLRERGKRSAALYDGYRIDHLIGFFRTYVRKAGIAPAFWPEHEEYQRAMGDRLLTVFQESGASLIAEDLGTVPDFLRVSLAEHRVPGMKVLRWEREWNVEGHPFIDPVTYPATSVATSGTHDTETMAEWWDGADANERRTLLRIPGLRETGISPDDPFSDRVRDALLGVLLSAGSGLIILPVQDIFGWRDRVNTPALVSDLNWSWRLPLPVEDLATDAEAAARAVFLSALARTHSRS
jgi:4-alpha-glucanotransferase